MASMDQLKFSQGSIQLVDSLLPEAGGTRVGCLLVGPERAGLGTNGYQWLVGNSWPGDMCYGNQVRQHSKHVVY